MEAYGILLIGSDVAHHAVVAALLEPCGVAVRRAADAAAALAAVQDARPAMILLDVCLGAEGEGELLALLRQAQRWVADCPVIALASIPPVDDGRYLNDRGFDGWLRKPVRPAELLMLVGRHLGTDLADALPDGGQSPLSKLLGEEAAAALVARLHDQLREAVTAIDEGADPGPIGHRMGGLAGTMGFPMLSAAWLSLQDSSAGWPTVRCLTIEALDEARSPPPVS